MENIMIASATLNMLTIIYLVFFKVYPRDSSDKSEINSKIQCLYEMINDIKEQRK